MLHTCSTAFRDPDADQLAVETSGIKAMVSLFNGTQSESLEALRYSSLCRKVASAKTFVKPENLPPTTSAANLHSRRTYLQMMQWMRKDDHMDPSEWGWAVQENRLVPLMMSNKPAPDVLLNIIRCNCATGCITLRCTCKRHMLECTTACGHNCENTARDSVSDDEHEN